MSSHGDQLKYALGISSLVTFYGVASLIVFYLGPQYGIGITYQIVLVALILITLPFALVINAVRKRRAAKQEAAQQAAGGEVQAQEGAPQKGKVPARAFEELSRSAEEAVQWLRSTRLGAAKTGDAVYALPWYLTAGPQRSGKTSLLLSSGLDFHTLPSQRRAEQQIVRPTRNVDWRVTDSAVLLDTAGRYQNDSPDRDEWAALAETLIKYRDDRPLDGFLLTVSAAGVLRLSEAEIEQQAKILRARLDEVMQRVKTRFPVYLIFTHADAVEGFRNFFDSARQEGRAEVWGATIPLEKSVNAHAMFDAEFDLLYGSLMRKRLLRLAAPEQPAQKLRVFNFPIRFGEARRKLGLFTSILFRPNPFSESPLLRGFYFTANLTEAGDGGDGRAARRSAQGSAESPTAALREDAVAEVLRPVGEGYFAEKFFKEVVLRDKDLAASFQALKKRPPRLRNILLIVGAVLLLLLLAGAVVSFFANRRLIDEGVVRGSRVLEIVNQDQGKDVLLKEPAAARVEIEAAEDLRELLAQLDQYEQVRPPIYMRFGLYSGDEMNERLRPLYFDIIEQRFKKPVVRAIENDLRAFAAGNPVMPPPTAASVSSGDAPAAPTQEEILGRHYDLLKAYLMLSNEHIDKIEPTFLANQLRDYWKKNAPADMELLSHQQLDFWARQAARDDFPHLRVDPELVSQSRLKLQAYPAVNRFYKRITTEINTKVNPINLDTILAGRGGGVLSSTYTVPGSFTIEGYRDHMKTAIEMANEEISKDDWVMGSGTASAATQGDEIGKLQSMYFREYTDQWRKFVRGMSVREFSSKEDAVDAFKSLSATDSPLERVMQEVARNTNLSARPEGQGWWDWFVSWFYTPEETATGGNTEVEKEFLALFQFAQSEKGKPESAPISQYRAELRRVLDPLETLSPEQLGQMQKSLAAGKDDIGLQKAEQNVSRMLDGFKTASAVDVASLLKQPLDNLRVLVYGKGYKEIEKTWREQLYPRAHALESGFPFTETGESSVTDLARYLNPNNGQFTVFFNERLAPSFDDAQGQWKLKESSVFKFSDEYVKYLNDARKLREALFPSGGQQPEVSYDITLQPVKDTDIVIEIGGKRVETKGTTAASTNFVWPVRSGASDVRITVLPNGGEPAEKSYTGEWAIFKMFNAGGATKTGDNQYNLNFNVGGVSVKATLRPSSANNPFERSLFTNLRAPENLQK